MSELEEIERDLREYLDKEPNLRREDRLEYLTAIFNKRSELMKLPHVVNYYDYFNMLSGAKNLFIRMKLPVRITGKQLEPPDATHIATLETFIGYLNKNNLLKKLVKFDYTE